MPAWNELLEEIGSLPPDQAGLVIKDRLTAALVDISRLRGDTNVVLYGSAFLQRPNLPFEAAAITAEDINGIMSVIYGMTWARGLTLLLHTPGGSTNAADTIVAYLRSKFDFIEVIVPTYAMSAGTMISLAADRVVMGRQSQLGPIDPQLNGLAARSIVDQFNLARVEILGDPAMGKPGNVDAAHLWAPVLGTIGPALLVEAQNALDYGERMVGEWLARWMFKGHADPAVDGRRVAHTFGDASLHKSHGRRIDRAEAQTVGVTIEELEASQDLQEAVLTAYHLMTIVFEKTPAAKLLWTNTDRTWIKNVGQVTLQPVPPPPGAPAPEPQPAS
jgi:Serine dehydrogenase proteinase